KIGSSMTINLVGLAHLLRARGPIPQVGALLTMSGDVTTYHDPTLPPVRIPGSLSLILPAHNEVDNIEIVIRRALEVLPRHVDEFEIIPVNDGSRDETGRVIDQLAREDHRVRPVHHRVNRGYVAAIKSGFTASRLDYVMFIDADRQFDIADILQLAPFVASHDILARFRMDRSDPMIRRFNPEVFNLAVRVLFVVYLRDL